jgi:PD-(D/E)XK nuclease superfamily
MALWFGTGIHYALEKYYDPLLQRDPVESFSTWYHFQWEGGIVGEDWLDLTYDLHPRLVTPPSHSLIGEPTKWDIRGLKEILPNLHEVQDEFELHKQLGVGMMEFYREWAPKNDNFVTVAAESTYSIPLGFDAVDMREDSPNYGKTLQVHARGKRDAVIYFPEIDRFGINDHKTAARIDEDYFLKLDKDEQCSNYLWATIMESQLNTDLPWYNKPVDRVLYTALRKNYPKPPSVLQSGFLSLDRQKEGTTAELFKEAVLGNENLEAWFRDNEKAQLYYTYLCEVGDSAFIQRDLVTRNKREIEMTGVHLAMVAKEMVSSPAIYPNPTGEFRCLQCAFRSPCIAADDGSDWIGMLQDGYEVNRDR